MTTLTYTRRLNTGQYEHAEASCTISPEDIGLTREAATQHIRSLVHMTLGMEEWVGTAAPANSSISTSSPSVAQPLTAPTLTPAPSVVAPASAAVGIAPPPIVAAVSASTEPSPVPPIGVAVAPVSGPALATVTAPTTASPSEPELDDITFRRIAGHHVERINKLRPGRGGTEVNALTAEFVEPPLGLSAIPMERRQEYKARLEAIQ